MLWRFSPQHNLEQNKSFQEQFQAFGIDTLPPHCHLCSVRQGSPYSINNYYLLINTVILVEDVPSRASSFERGNNCNRDSSDDRIWNFLNYGYQWMTISTSCLATKIVRGEPQKGMLVRERLLFFISVELLRNHFRISQTSHCRGSITPLLHVLDAEAPNTGRLDGALKIGGNVTGPSFTRTYTD